jgi:DNA-binding CsgD family transcriptional regulator
MVGHSTIEDETASALVGKLTTRQRDCLRLVAQGYVTKEIARKLSISDLRASKDIDAAMKKLGVSRRIDAARLLAEHEDREVNVIPGATLPLSGSMELQASSTSTEEKPTFQMLREERSPYHVSNTPPDLGWPLRQRGGAHNDLNIWQRVIWIVLLWAAFLIGFGTLASGIASLSERIVIPSSG